MHTGDGRDVRCGGAGGPVTVRRGVPEGAEGRVADLYWEAFGRKLGAALNPPATGRRFLAAHLQHDRGVVALAGDQVVGVAGFKLGDRAFIGAGAAAVLDTYGAVRGLPRLVVLAILERTPRRGQLVMDGIAVDAGHRSRGIGSVLLEEIVRVAAENGCGQVRLDVIDVNPRAQVLYERLGFIAGRTERTPYLRRLMGFSAVTTMYRTVDAAGDDGR